MTIKHATFNFLEKLLQNNNREWFQENKASYDAAHADVKIFVEGLIEALSRFDPEVPADIKAAKAMFRIYRDVRFSKDKSPYKSWFAAGISKDGRKLAGPEYYIHIEPNNSFIAVGYWQPAKPHLDAIRQEIDYNYDNFIELLKAQGWDIKDLYVEDKLKRPPVGYTLDNPAIELLKLKSFILHKPLSDAELSRPFALQHIVEIFQRALHFKEFVQQAIDLD